MPRRKEPTIRVRGGIINAVLSADKKRSNGKPIVTKKRTFAQDVVSVMRGGRIMNAKQVVEALIAAGIDINSSSPPSYVATTLATAHTMVKGPNGDAFKVPTFTRVESGRYRVSNQEDIRLATNGAIKPGAASDPVQPLVRTKGTRKRRHPDVIEAARKTVSDRKAEVVSVINRPSEKLAEPGKIDGMAPPDKLRAMMRTMIAEHVKPIMEEEIRNTANLEEMMQSLITEHLQPILTAEIRKTLQRMLDN